MRRTPSRTRSFVSRRPGPHSPEGLLIRTTERRRDRQSSFQVQLKILDSRKAVPMSATSLNETVGKQLLDRQAGAMRSTWAERIDAVGRHSARYGLVLVLLWIGGPTPGPEPSPTSERPSPGSMR